MKASLEDACTTVTPVGRPRACSIILLGLTGIASESGRPSLKPVN